MIKVSGPLFPVDGVLLDVLCRYSYNCYTSLSKRDIPLLYGDLHKCWIGQEDLCDSTRIHAKHLLAKLITHAWSTFCAFLYGMLDRKVGPSGTGSSETFTVFDTNFPAYLPSGQLCL